MGLQETMTEKALEHQMNSHLYRTLANAGGPMSDTFRDIAIREMGMSMLCYSLAKPTSFVTVTV